MEQTFEVLDGGKATPRPSLSERFMAHVVEGDGADACWAWRGTHRKGGAGVFCVAAGENGNMSAVRVSFILEYGPLLSWQQLVNVPGCRLGKACCRPDHYRIAPRPRRRPAHIARYDQAYRETAVAAAVKYGVALRTRPAHKARHVEKLAAGALTTTSASLRRRRGRVPN